MTMNATVNKEILNIFFITNIAFYDLQVIYRKKKKKRRSNIRGERLDNTFIAIEIVIPVWDCTNIADAARPSAAGA